MKRIGWILSILLFCWGGLGAAAWASGDAGGRSSTSADWAAESNQVSASFGSSVASAGDVNGDGYEDVIMAAANYQHGQSDDRGALAFYGSAEGLSHTPNWKAEPNQDTAFGSVASAGDVNGDGYGDVIVGASDYSHGQTTEGAAFVFHGSAEGLSTTPNWAAEANQEDAAFGGSVASAGDVNGDGYDDVIVGADGYDNVLEDEGRVFVFQGSARGPSQKPNWTATAKERYAYFGASVASAGDVNGDGFADVIVGATFYAADRGKTFVFHGSAGGLNRTPDWTAESNQDESLFYHVAGAGDVNGDGYADVIVGAGGYTNGQYEEGRAFVFHGSAVGLSLTPDWKAESNQELALLGNSVASAGDVNGDGYDDVIVGAPGYDNGQTDEGKAFVFHGSAGGLGHAPNWTAEPNQENSHLGGSVAGAGDVNGDGYDDVIVTGVHNNGQTDEGPFVFHGSSEGLSYTPNWKG